MSDLRWRRRSGPFCEERALEFISRASGGLVGVAMGMLALVPGSGGESFVEKGASEAWSRLGRGHGGLLGGMSIGRISPALDALPDGSCVRVVKDWERFAH